MQDEVLNALREAFASRHYLFTLHAVRQAEERRISPTEIEEAMLRADRDVIEDYPNDARGASCLLLGVTRAGRMLHVHTSYPPDVWVIAGYSSPVRIDGSTGERDDEQSA